MKRIFFIILLINVISCYKDEERLCSVPLPEFALYVNKNSEIYKEFIIQEGEIDKFHIRLYRQVDNEKKYYDINFRDTNLLSNSNNRYIVIETQLWFDNDVYTGKTETLYLQNATKIYKIEVDGYMKKTECGSVAVANKIRVNGTKIEVPYLVK